jgi:hypothetical protein
MRKKAKKSARCAFLVCVSYGCAVISNRMECVKENLEVSDEMLRAGLAMLYGFDRRFDAYEEIVPKIWKAMEEARRLSLPRS